ncbi:hypothetical protein EV421DRAFT_1740188 [Armillaria borealis]|uniref:Uncharacterized protein n=1 Tax=Armillaria borealis TaxID=47425 RepID=A0AA39J3N8_9AGAR|nr:hypothetical protein EV421DRAFT_1740188 [Armillaria borealis]
MKSSFPAPILSGSGVSSSRAVNNEFHHLPLRLIASSILSRVQTTRIVLSLLDKPLVQLHLIISVIHFIRALVKDICVTVFEASSPAQSILLDLQHIVLHNRRLVKPPGVKKHHLDRFLCSELEAVDSLEGEGSIGRELEAPIFGPLCPLLNTLEPSYDSGYKGAVFCSDSVGNVQRSGTPLKSCLLLDDRIRNLLPRSATFLVPERATPSLWE